MIWEIDLQDRDDEILTGTLHYLKDAGIIRAGDDPADVPGLREQPITSELIDAVRKIRASKRRRNLLTLAWFKGYPRRLWKHRASDNFLGLPRRTR